MSSTAAGALLAGLALFVTVAAVIVTAALQRRRPRGTRCFMCDTAHDLTNATRRVRVCYTCLSGQGPGIP